MPTAQTLMAQGRVLVSSTGDNNISDFQLALDQNGLGTVSIAPSPTGGDPQVVGTNGWSISANCTNQQQAAAFIDYFINSSEGAATLQGQTGLRRWRRSSTSRRPAGMSRTRSSPGSRSIASCSTAARASTSGPTARGEFVTQFRTAYEEVAFGRGDPQQVAADFIAQANTALSGF